MKSVMSHNFAQVPNAEIQRSQFDRSHGWKGTFLASYLVPFYVDEVLPGDTHNLQVHTMARMATPLVPYMDNLFAETFFFFVPNRLVWNNWEKFMGAQEDPGDSIDFTIPVLDKDPGFTVALADRGDYLGIQPNAYGPTSPDINALPFRGMNLIWNEWFRDQNLQDSLDVNKDDGPDAYADYPMLVRGKRYDYFTSALPWPQKGDAVTLPLGTSAEVLRKNNAVYGFFYQSGTNTPSVNSTITAAGGVGRVTAATGGADLAYDPKGGNSVSNLYADLSTATAATINSIREAFQIQRLLERDARGGTRYVEILLSHFGVTAPDFRLQRPEYLGGSSTRIVTNPVAQTSSTDATTPQGNLAAFGTFAHSGRNGFVKSFVEHGYLFGFIQVRADLNYQTGLDRMWSRQTRYDFYWPALSHLGEQPVYNKELFVADVVATDEAVFGYQERYAEYRYKRSNITGLFRSNAVGTIDYWHFAQDYDSAPTLNGAFILDSTSTILTRNIAVPTEPQFLCDIYLNLKSARPMPTYSVPGFIDRF